MKTFAKFTILLTATILTGCGGSPGGAINPVPFLQPVFEGLNTPSAVRVTPDGRVFITELSTGRVRIGQNGSLLETDFATLPVQTDGEQGLLGLALDPNFTTNHFVYFCYSDSASNRNKVVRFTDSANVGTSETVIIDNLPIAGNHNGGRIAFGPDGKLYVTIGENGDPANSQNASVLPGKVLRFNPDGSIPADNPIAGNPMWAMGLRNSFGLAFQPSTGSPFVSENGPTCDDEINLIAKGGNYGWRPDQPCNDGDPSFTRPLIRFNPTIAPTGIAFVSGGSVVADGTLLMTSFNDGAIRAFTLTGGSISKQQKLLSGQGNLFDITQAPDGSIYVAGNDTVYRLPSWRCPVAILFSLYFGLLSS